MDYTQNAAISPATANSPYPTSVMPASTNAPMVSPAMYDNSKMMPYQHKGAVAGAHYDPFSDPAMILVLFILLVIILRGRCF